MNLRTFMPSVIVGGVLLTGPALAQAAPDKNTSAHKQTQIQLVRNATLKISYADTTFLVDPMLAKKGAYPGFEGTYRSTLRNPLLELPMSVDEVIAGVDAIIVTHTHLDHWDEAAQQLLPKDLPIFVQHEADAALIKSQGFKQVTVIHDQTKFAGITVTKTGGQHGTDEMYAVPQLAALLGEAMGVVFKAPGYKTTYVVGDTVWNGVVEQALNKHQPDVVILNTGYAQIEGFPNSIIMGKEDVTRTKNIVPEATIIRVHMDAVNHAALSRKELREFVKANNLTRSVKVPNDGEILKL